MPCALIENGGATHSLESELGCTDNSGDIEINDSELLASGNLATKDDVVWLDGTCTLLRNTSHVTQRQRSLPWFITEIRMDSSCVLLQSNFLKFSVSSYPERKRVKGNLHMSCASRTYSSVWSREACRSTHGDKFSQTPRQVLLGGLLPRAKVGASA